VLISLHLPKTAGTSFHALLASHFGDRLRDDYADRPLHATVTARRLRALRAGIRLLQRPGELTGVDAVHGHFLAIKYSLWRGGPGWRRVTWLREPVERLASHYHYWRRSYAPESAGLLHRRMMEEGWSLERFCLGPELRNIYQQFLWGVPLGRFDFVGITEHFDHDIDDFARRILGIGSLCALDGDGAGANVNPAAPSRYVEDASLRARIERYHAADVTLYRAACARRQQRLQQG